MKLIYNETQLKKAAKYVFKHNKLLAANSYDEVFDLIYTTMIKFAGEVKQKFKRNELDWTFVSTGGFTILIFVEDEIGNSSQTFMEAEITVDPSVSASECKTKSIKV